jgi:hypothetical protein
MHGEAELVYARRRTWIDLPVILGSGAIAFLNAGSSSLFEDSKMASISLGIGSLVVGTINTLGSYFAFAKLAEGHRIAALSYSKQGRFLRVELGLPRDERMRPGDLLKLVKNETDRLAETAPAVPPAVRQKFKTRFKSAPIAKPTVANGIHPAEVYQEQVVTLLGEAGVLLPASSHDAVHHIRVPEPAVTPSSLPSQVLEDETPRTD